MKNSIRERSKINNDKVKQKVNLLYKCIDSLYYLEMNDFVTDKEADKIRERIHNKI